jgi:hypothetical protein
MTGEPASHSSFSSGGMALPPVYTNWGEAPAVASTRVAVLPYFAGRPAAAISQGDAVSAPAAVVAASPSASQAPAHPATEERVPAPPSGVIEPEGAVVCEPTSAPIWTAARDLVPASTPTAAARDLAERLETIAGRLRTDGTAAVVAGMRGDRFDALLAGVIAGYLAARDPDT